MIGEMNDAAERFAVIKTILHKGIAGHAGDAKLNPGVPGKPPGFRNSEVLHDANGFCVRTERGVEESMGPCIFIGIGKREFVAKRILLQKTKRMTQSNVVIDPGGEDWPDEIGAQHYKEIR